MTPSKRLALLLGGALLGAGALSLSGDAPAAEDASPVTTAGPAALPQAPSYEMPPPATGGEGREDCVFEAGARLAYRVDLSTRVVVDGAAADVPLQGAAEAERRTGLRLELEALSGTDSSEPATLLASYGEVQSSALADPGALTTPFLVRVGRDCSLAGFARHAGTHRAHARLQQSLLHELGWRWREGDDEGANGIGRYLATVAVAEPAEGLLVQRRLRRYEQVWADDADAVQVRRSLLSVRVGSGPWFEGLTGVEEVEQGPRRSITELAARRAEPRDGALAGRSRRAEDYVWEDLLPADVSIRTPRPITQQDRERQAAVAHLDVEEAVERYLERARGGVGIERVWPELTDYLEARPEQTAPLVHRMQDGEIPSEARPGVYMALSRARTPEAKQVLVAVATQGQAPIIERTRAMFALIDRDDVGVETAELLAAQADGGSDDAAAETLARESLLALGAMAGQQQEPAVTALALAAAETRLQTASSADQMRSAFGAIGNVGDPAALSLVEPYTRAADPAVREEVAHAIRRLHPETSAAWVSRWLDHETHPLVERRLFQTLVFQCADHQAPPGADVTARALRTLERQPTSLMTRKALIRLLGAYVEAHPSEPLARQAREALVAQVPLELEARSGLYDVIAPFLGADDLHRALGHEPLGLETDR